MAAIRHSLHAFSWNDHSWYLSKPLKSKVTNTNEMYWTLHIYHFAIAFISNEIELGKMEDSHEYKHKQLLEFFLLSTVDSE